MPIDPTHLLSVFLLMIQGFTGGGPFAIFG